MMATSDEYDATIPGTPRDPQAQTQDLEYDPAGPVTYAPGARVQFTLPDGTKSAGTVIGPGMYGKGVDYAVKHDDTGQTGNVGSNLIAGLAPPLPPPTPLRPDFGQSVPARLAQGIVEEGTQAADAMTLGHAADIQAYTRALADRLGTDPASMLALVAATGVPGMGAQAAQTMGQTLAPSAAQYRPMFQAGINQFQDQNPVTSAAMRFGGGALGFGAGTGAVQGAVGTAGRAVMPYLPTGAGQFLQAAGNFAQGINPLRAAGLEAAYPAMTKAYNYLSPIAAGMLNGYAGAQANNLLGGPDQGRIDPDLGAAIGGGLGTVAPALSEIGDYVGAKALPAVADMAKRFGDRFGWTPTVKQMTTSPAWKFLGSVTAGYAPKEQIPNFTRALSNLVGQDTDSMTPASGIVKRIYDNASQGFQDFANNANNNIKVDPQLLSDLGGLASKLNAPFPQGGLGNSPARDQAEMLLRKLASYGAGNDIPAKDWMDVMQFTHQLRDGLDTGRLNGAEFVNKLVDAIGDAVKRNAPAGNAGAGYATWHDFQKLNELWKNALVADKAIGATNGTGQVPPKKLLDIVKEVYPNYSKGAAGDMGTLAEVGQLLPELDEVGAQKPQTSLEHASPVLNLASSLGGAIGGGITAAGPGGLTAAGFPLAIGGAGLLAKAMAKEYFNSPQAANNLIRRSLGQPGIPGPYPQNMLNGWLASQNTMPNSLGVQK